MTVSAILRAAPVLSNLATESDYAEAYTRDSLTPRPGLDLRDIPILVGHEKTSDPIGHVTAIHYDECRRWPGGQWAYVHATITDPPGWLREGTGVSISRSALEYWTPWGCDFEIIQRALVSEVSLLTPGTEPAFAGAAVEWMEIKRETPKRVPPAAPSLPADVEYPQWWRDLEGKVGYRITDENLERAIIEANRTPLEKIYGEHMAANRRREPVLIRRNIGQVLGVR